MEQSPDATLITTTELDPPGPEIVYANPAFCRMTGYERDELLGWTPRVFQGPDTDRRKLHAVRQRLERRESLIETAVNYRKDGSPYTVEWSITPVWDQALEREYFVSIQRVVDARHLRDETVRSVFASAPLGVLLVNGQGRIESANDTVCRLFDYDREDLLGEPVELLVPEEWRSGHCGHRSAYQAQPETRSMGAQRDLYGQCRDGSRIPLEIGLSPVAADDGCSTLVTVIDVSQRKHAEGQLAAHARTQAALAAFGEAALRESSVSSLARRLVDIVTRELGFAAAMLVENVPNGSPGLLEAAGCETPDSAADRYALAADPAAAEALETGGIIPLSIQGLRMMTSRLNLEAGAMADGGVCVPIIEPTRRWGVLYALGGTADEADEASAYLVSLCQIIASAARRERDRKQVQDVEHMRSLAGRLAHVGGWSVDLDAGRLRWSDEVCLIHEVAPGTEVSIAEGINYYAPEARHRMRRLFQACTEQGESFDDQLDIITATGRRRTVRTIGEAVRDDAGIIREVRGALQDVTEQRRTERDLLQSQQRLRQFADAMPTIVWTAEPDGTLDYANRRFLECSGIGNEVLPGDGWLQAVHPDDRERVVRAWAEAVASESDYELDLRLYCTADDDYRWHYVSAVPVRDDGGVLRKWYGSALDIHDRKDLEEELVRVASRLTSTLESITDGFYTLDAQWRLTYFNAEAERLMRTPRGDVLGTCIWDAFPDLSGTRLESEYRCALDEQVTRQFETYSRALDTWFEIHVYPAADGLTVYFRDVTQRKRSEAEITFLAFHDPLTELPNRRALQDRLAALLEDDEHSSGYGALLLVDLDHFKTLNDTLGHTRGDEFLKTVALRLRSVFGDGRTIARVGGDEFAVVLTGVGDTADEANRAARAAGEQALATLSASYALDAGHHKRTCSIGMTLLYPAGDHVEEVMKRVDLALFRAKQQGRDRLGEFDPALQEQANTRLQVEREMPQGLARGEFIPYFQATVGRDGQLIGAEALVRWHHAERGLVSPGTFIPVAEETGLIHDLGEVVLRRVCEQLVVWSQHPGMAHLVCSVNVSVSQFRSPAFVERVQRILAETGVNPARVRLEVTESLMVDDVEATISRMEALRDLGITFALDDFGTGYSSLAYLKRLPLDVIKIDQSFVRGVLSDANDAAIVQTIIALAGSMGLDVLAEGVEEAAVRDYLLTEGCFCFQGYYFGRPMPAVDFELLPGCRRRA